MPDTPKPKRMRVVPKIEKVDDVRGSEWSKPIRDTLNDFLRGKTDTLKWKRK